MDRPIQQKSEPTTLQADGSLKENRDNRGPGNYNSTIPPLVYTIEEAAALLKIGRSLLYYQVKTKQLPSIKMGKRILIPYQALMNYLATASEGLISHASR